MIRSRQEKVVQVLLVVMCCREVVLSRGSVERWWYI